MFKIYTPHNVCAKQIDLSLKDGLIEKVAFTGGCPGSLQGISSLAEGMPAKMAAEKLKGITCSNKGTSCPDQLAKAIEEALATP